jgi:hypothetical protein
MEKWQISKILNKGQVAMVNFCIFKIIFKKHIDNFENSVKDLCIKQQQK